MILLISKGRMSVCVCVYFCLVKDLPTPLLLYIPSITLSLGPGLGATFSFLHTSSVASTPSWSDRWYPLPGMGSHMVTWQSWPIRMEGEREGERGRVISKLVKEVFSYKFLLSLKYLCCEAARGRCSYIIRNEDIINRILLHPPRLVECIITEFLDENIS